jgi:erythromycin esterase-like protein
MPNAVEDAREPSYTNNIQPTNNALNAVREAAQPLTGTNHDYDSLFELIADAHLVLLGEATHGTHDTKRLTAEKNFDSPSARRRVSSGLWA